MKFTEEHIQKLRDAWTLERKQKEKDRMLNKKLTNTGRTRFKKGLIPWNAGKKGLQKSIRKGVTWEQEYGIKKASELRQRCGTKGKHWKLSEETKKKMRQFHIINKSIIPNRGKYETRILNLLEQSFNYPIYRQYKIAGYFIDGYCAPLNLAIEIDEIHHRRTKMEDKIREMNIKKEINCQFLRIAVEV